MAEKANKASSTSFATTSVRIFSSPSALCLCPPHTLHLPPTDPLQLYFPGHRRLRQRDLLPKQARSQLQAPRRLRPRQPIPQHPHALFLYPESSPQQPSNFLRQHRRPRQRGYPNPQHVHPEHCNHQHHGQWGDQPAGVSVAGPPWTRNYHPPPTHRPLTAPAPPGTVSGWWRRRPHLRPSARLGSRQRRRR